MGHSTRVVVHRVALIDGEASGVAEGLDEGGVTTIYRDDVRNLEPIIARLEAGHEVIVDVPDRSILARALPPGRGGHGAQQDEPAYSADLDASEEQPLRPAIRPALGH